MKDAFRARALGLVVAMIASALMPVLGAGQASSTAKATGAKAPAAKASWRVPRTPWGDPDLQGMWSYASLTPLERTAALAGREFFTADEAATRNVEATQDRPPAPGDPGAYNAHWFDRGTVTPDRRTSLIVDPPDGRLPLTEAARKKLAAKAAHRREHPADSWLDRTTWDRCITYHGVPPLSTGYNNTYQIFQTREYVAIYVENIHDVRIIPIDGRPRLTDKVRQWNGSSRGRWEGDTLVVETTNYSDQTEMRFPASQHTRAVERFRRVSDDLIESQFTIEDSTLYTKPWTAVRPMPRLTDYQIFEYACHEANYAMPNILAGERTREKEAAAAQTSSAAPGR
jgi:hypothetical protein